MRGTPLSSLSYLLSSPLSPTRHVPERVGLAPIDRTPVDASLAVGEVIGSGQPPVARLVGVVRRRHADRFLDPPATVEHYPLTHLGVSDRTDCHATSRTHSHSHLHTRGHLGPGRHVEQDGSRPGADHRRYNDVHCVARSSDLARQRQRSHVRIVSMRSDSHDRLQRHAVSTRTVSADT
jgi:hypothetical protein